MPEEFPLEIGGCSILLQLPQEGEVPERLLPFRNHYPFEDPCYILRTSLKPPLFQRGKIFYGKGKVLQFSCGPKGLLIEMFLNPPLDFSPWALLLKRECTQGILYLKKETTILSSLIWAVFLIVYYLLIKQGGIFAHASGVIDRRKGFLFVGPSGAGKSTLASLCQEEKDSVVLNDDQIIVRKNGRTFWLFGTPWHGPCKSISSQSAPLTAIFFLSHGKQNRLIPLSPKEALKRFLPELYIPPWDPNGRPTLLSLALEVCAKIPSYSLAFTPQKEVVPFLRDFFKNYDKNHTKKTFP